MCINVRKPQKKSKLEYFKAKYSFFDVSTNVILWCYIMKMLLIENALYCTPQITSYIKQKTPGINKTNLQYRNKRSTKVL